MLQIINFIRGQPLNHRLFQALLKELDTTFNDVILFANARWLSQGNVLIRFHDLFEEIKEFLKNSKRDDLWIKIIGQEWHHELSFLTDIYEHLNQLNLKLQGENVLIFSLVQHIREFQLKLESFKRQISDGDFTFFPRLLKHKHDSSLNLNRFVNLLEVLISEFEQRFSDFKKLLLVYKFLKNPFNVQIANLEELSIILEVNKAHLESDVASILCDDQITNEKTEVMWKRLLSDHSFLILNNVVPKYLSMFGSTYLSESTFSLLKYRKSKYRSCLTQTHLEADAHFFVMHQIYES